MRKILGILMGLAFIAPFVTNADPPPVAAAAPAYDGAKVIAIATAEMGEFKAPGQDDARVRQYVTETMNNDDIYVSDGWCSGFVSWVLKQAGYKWSPNNTDYGWGFVIHRVDKPKLGDIAMLDSHIAFYYGDKVNPSGRRVVGLMGGNQDYQCCVMWVDPMDIEYYAEADVAPPGWVPTKHIPNGMSPGNAINVLDDHNAGRIFTAGSTHRTQNGHPL